MIVIPIGHDEMTVQRLPWATIVIALVCIGVQARASYIESAAEDARRDLRSKIERVVREGLSKRAAEHNQKRGSAKVFRFDPTLAASLLGEALQEEVLRYRKELADLERQHPASRLGYRPAEDGFDKMMTSAFAHGGWLHLILNLLFLYLVGCNLEDRWGWWRFALFYLGGAVAAGFTFSLWHESGLLIGASGAIAAAMGAFVLVFWRANIRLAYWLGPIMGTFELPAWCALALWFVEQALLSFVEASASLRIAYSAHVGGFVFGLAVAGGALLIARLRARRAKEARAAAPARLTKRRDTVAPPRAAAVAAAAAVADQLLVDARRLASEGKAREALDALDAYLGTNPRDVPARELALAAAEAARIDTAIGRHASALFGPWITMGQLARVAELFRFLHDNRPEAILDERALLHVLTVGRTLADNELLLAAAGDYAEHYPDGKELPRILWTAAEAQEAQGRADVALRTLRSLLARFPLDPLAKQARRRISPSGELIKP